MHSKTLSSFQQEMKKLAESAARDTVASDIKKKRRDAARDRQATGKAQLSVLGGSIGAYAVTMALLKNPFQPGTREEMVKHVHQMAEKMGLGKLHVRTPQGFESGSWNPYFSFDNSVNIPLHLRDSVIAHELGHAKNFKTIGEMGEKFARKYYAAQDVSRLASSYTLAPALASSAAMSSGSKAVYVPGVLQAILSAPMLAEEAAASARATAHLIREHGVGEGVFKSLPLIPAFATYAAVAGAPLLVAYLRRSAAEKAALKDQKTEVVVEKVKTSKKDDGSLSFFERHPKKLLGGAALAAVGTGLLLKGKKVPTAVLPKSVPAATKTAPAKLSLEEAIKAKFPGARPLPKPKPPAKVSVHKFQKPEKPEKLEYEPSQTFAHRDRSEPPVFNPKGTHKALKRKAKEVGSAKPKFDEADADKLLKAMGDFTKHSSIASRLAVAYSLR